jgi:hypothetical protein
MDCSKIVVVVDDVDDDRIMTYIKRLIMIHYL